MVFFNEFLNFQILMKIFCVGFFLLIPQGIPAAYYAYPYPSWIYFLSHLSSPAQSSSDKIIIILLFRFLILDALPRALGRNLFIVGPASTVIFLMNNFSSFISG